MQTLSQIRATFLDYLQQKSVPRAPRELYDPVDYILRLGGKRMRPVLLLLAYGMYGDDWKAALPAALSIEVFHNFTLVHDDIMDAAALRRGQPTVHEKYGQNVAILSGDVMLIRAYEYLASAANTSEQLAVVLKIFNETAIGVCEGQQMDMNFETRMDVSIEEYLRMIELKTAVLLKGATEIGAVLGGATLDEARKVGEYARSVGIAFQLQDDILDTYGDPTKFGKTVGGDIIQNKKTYLMLSAFEQASESDRQMLFQLYSSPTTDPVAKVEHVRAYYDQYDVRARAERVMQDYQDRAKQFFDLIYVSDVRKASLWQVAEDLFVREF